MFVYFILMRIHEMNRELSIKKKTAILRLHRWFHKTADETPSYV